MKSPAYPPDTLREAFSQVIEEAVLRVSGGEPLHAFCDWFCASLQVRLDPVVGGRTEDPESARRFMLALARKLWSGVPMLALRWRRQALPRVERNDRCYCGSGRKFKQCCAELADLPEVIDPDHVLGLVLANMRPAQLTLAQLRQVPPAALAAAAVSIQQAQGDERVAELLEPLFRDPAGLDERHDQAFDMLMDSLLALGQETRRQRVVQSVSACGNKALPPVRVAATSRCWPTAASMQPPGSCSMKPSACTLVTRSCCTWRW